MSFYCFSYCFIFSALDCTTDSVFPFFHLRRCTFFLRFIPFSSQGSWQKPHSTISGAFKPSKETAQRPWSTRSRMTGPHHLMKTLKVTGNILYNRVCRRRCRHGHNRRNNPQSTRSSKHCSQTAFHCRWPNTNQTGNRGQEFGKRNDYVHYFAWTRYDTMKSTSRNLGWPGFSYADSSLLCPLHALWFAGQI